MSVFQKYLSRCPYCDEEQWMRVIFNVGQYFGDERVVICMKCGLIFLNPREAQLEDFYKSDEYSEIIREGAQPSQNIIDRSEALSKMRAGLMKEHLPDTVGTHLDIGTGAGWTLDIVKNHSNLKPVGIEATPGFAEWASQKHDVMIINDIFPCDIPFDDVVSISLIHVVEHLEFPFDTLRYIYDMLPIGGMFFIEYPDIVKAMRREDEDGYCGFNPHEYFQKSHIFEFYFDFLRVFLINLGFKIRIVYTFEKFPLDKNIMFVLEKIEHGQTIEPVDSLSEKIIEYIGDRLKLLRPVEIDDTI